MATAVFSQGKVKGTVLDNELKGALPGVNVLVKGSTSGASTDMDGKFILNTTAASGQVVISYVGFQTQTVNFKVSKGETVDLGTIKLVSNSNELEDVVIKSSVIDVAKDRKTPVAVSTIRASEIQQKLGNQEFPEILANTPSVYATKSGGGFGDSRVNIRGFDQKNIAVMINGVPVNDMENSAVYWSNWAGLSDVTSSMQVQRGLGSSKLAISSVGGTINVITRTSDMKEGGSVSTSVANNNYLKTAVSYNTGKMKNGFSSSILLSQTMGEGYVDGTKFAGANYFIALGYEFSPKSDIQFTFTGAPQWHNQRSFAPTIANYIKYGQNGEPNIQYNSDWGYLNGQEYSFRTNFYHKPVMSLNWDYKFNSTTKLSAVVYGSWGRGGGSNGAGGIRGNSFSSDVLRRADGSINVDLIQGWNSGEQAVTIGGTPYVRAQNSAGFYQNSSASGRTGNGTSVPYAYDNTKGISKISSINSHNWYGGVINLNKKINSKMTVDFGIDARTYRGIHYQNINDLLGADNYFDNNDKNNPNRILSTTYQAKPNLNPFFSLDYQTAKINYNNDGVVNWYGAFTQFEYATEKLTAFVQGAVSNQGFKREDYFLYLNSDPLASTEFKNILGGNIKGGANYNINEHHNVFVNAGYYSKQPFFNAVYPNNRSLVNENLTNEKVIGFEAGYGFRSRVFNANLNLYHTTWKDRFQRTSDNAATNQGGYYDFAGITQVHSGIELDMNAKLDKLKLNGMVSYGNWVYQNDITGKRYDVANNEISGGTVTTYYVNGTKVGNVAQFTASAGATYAILNTLSVDANYRMADNLYASLDPTKQTSPTNLGTLKLPSYGLMDAGFSFKMPVGKDKSDSVNFRLNINNLLDTVYIAESRTNTFAKTRADFATDAAFQTYSNTLYKGLDPSNQVFFGFGRTWNFGITYNF
jgi:hypothetical protein